MTVIAEKQRKIKTTGSWRAGQTGNPRGRPKKYHAPIDELVRVRTDGGQTLVDFLAGVVEDSEAGRGDRIKAAAILLDRGFGRPLQTIESTSNEPDLIRHPQWVALQQMILTALSGFPEARAAVAQALNGHSTN